jgi:hypothetical protein
VAVVSDQDGVFEEEGLIARGEARLETNYVVGAEYAGEAVGHIGSQIVFVGGELLRARRRAGRQELGRE